MFSYGDSSPRLLVNMVAKTKNHPAILVLCESSGSRPFALCAITLNEKGYYVHFVICTMKPVKPQGPDLKMNCGCQNFLRMVITDFWGNKLVKIVFSSRSLYIAPPLNKLLLQDFNIEF